MLAKNWLLRSAALPAFIAGSAVAADLPVKAPAPVPAAVYDWTGFYVGLNAGGAWGNSDPSTSLTCTHAPGFTFSIFNCPNALLVRAAGTGSMSGTGFIGGGQIGYNLQSGSLVYGAELDFDSFNLKASRQVTANYVASSTQFFTISSSVSTTWLFTARARVGWAFNNLLAYATGGLAVTDLEASNSFFDNGLAGGAQATGTWSASKTQAGWTVGGGLEWAFARNWSAKAEYLYVHFDPTANGLITAAGGYGNAISTSTDLTANIARAGVNYKF
jgi:outer membrane immunogenic protein